VKSLPDIGAGQLEQVVFVEFLEDGPFQLDKLKVYVCVCVCVCVCARARAHTHTHTHAHFLICPPPDYKEKKKRSVDQCAAMRTYVVGHHDRQEGLVTAVDCHV
jgi:hypothetical protein